jgi:hypothetical protein
MPTHLDRQAVMRFEELEQVFEGLKSCMQGEM